MTETHAHEPAGLTQTALALMRSLPAEAYPRHTIERFPRIINQIALYWDRPDECRRYFDELLNDERGGRQGFPFEVVVEITNLKQEHARQHPRPLDVFDRQFDLYGKRF